LLRQRRHDRKQECSKQSPHGAKLNSGFSKCPSRFWSAATCRRFQCVTCPRNPKPRKRSGLNERRNLFTLQVRPMKKKIVEFCSHTGNLALMRDCVRDFLNGYPFSEKQRLLMVLGVDEACTNIIRYAYRF